MQLETMTTSNALASNPRRRRRRQQQGADNRPHIVFVHLDLGIGGAEQLVVNLASASLGPSTPGYAASQTQASHDDAQNGKDLELHELDANVSIYTTHCSPTHCFDVVKPPDGILASSVQVRGAFIPVNVPLFLIGGPRVGTALCSTLRMVYLTHCAARERPDADVFVVDVLPTGLPMLICWWMAKSALFYCHFPDKLLTRDTVNGVTMTPDTDASDESPSSSSQGQIWVLSLLKSAYHFLKALYRAALDGMEEITMRYADLIAVNSNFTRGEVATAFPTLTSSATSAAPGGVALPAGTQKDDGYIQVLYPPIDLNKFIDPDFESKQRNVKNGKVGPIFSLNRFERKKNVNVLLKAYAKLRRDLLADEKKGGKPIPDLVIAGGYDPRNVENVEHLAELKQLAADLDIAQYTTFAPSVGDDERAELLRSALCVVYTPHREHFGIVPLEAMYAGSPVIAVNSGGPKETVVHEETGLLVENTVEGFALALKYMVNNPTGAVKMGRKGHERVAANFGLDTFRARWADIVEETMERGAQRRRRWENGQGLDSKRIFPFWFTCMVEAMLALLAALLLTIVLKAAGILHPDDSVWGRFISRRTGDEL